MSLFHVQFVLLCCVSFADADVSGISAGSQKSLADAYTGTAEGSSVSPSVEKSDKKFFGKDYPWDKRPKVDVFHFKHPYPVVQDSDDFDSDFVKDENSDNGSWKAQTEYDRLRHKLAKEKADVAKALEAKKKAEQELKDALKKEQDAADKKKKEMEEEEKKKEKKVPASSASKGESEEKEQVKRKVVVPTESPGGVTSPGDVKVVAGDTEKAMDALEKCKKQLAEARERLKELMKELEEAKKKQQETQASLDEELERLRTHETKQEAVAAAAKKEHDEYLDAKAAYEKQQSKVAQMEADIKAAAAKVKAFRDGEDRDGGVYPTKKSGAASSFGMPFFALMLLAGTSLLQ